MCVSGKLPHLQPSYHRSWAVHLEGVTCLANLEEFYFVDLALLIFWAIFLYLWPYINNLYKLFVGILFFGFLWRKTNVDILLAISHTEGSPKGKHRRAAVSFGQKLKVKSSLF